MRRSRVLSALLAVGIAAAGLATVGTVSAGAQSSKPEADDVGITASELHLAELHMRADDPELKASTLGELLGVAYDEESVVVGETLVRFVPGGPQGRPQLHAELFV